MGNATWAEGLKLYQNKQAERCSEEQARKQRSSKASAPASAPVCVLALTSLSDGLRLGQASPINPFLPPSVTLVTVFITAIKNQVGQCAFTFQVLELWLCDATLGFLLFACLV